METVRVATLRDLDEVTQLLLEAIAGTPGRRGGHLFQQKQRQEESAGRIRRHLANATSQVLVSLLDDFVVGFAITLHTDGLGVIEELYVQPEARGVGLGESLLDQAVEWCRSAGCFGIDVQVLPGDRSAKNACERSGFSARALTMYRKL